MSSCNSNNTNQFHGGAPLTGFRTEFDQKLQARWGGVCNNPGQAPSVATQSVSEDPPEYRHVTNQQTDCMEIITLLMEYTYA